MLVKNNQGFYTLSSWDNHKNLVHGFSTSLFGDMGFKASSNKANREKFAKALGVTSDFVTADQPHGNEIAIVEVRDRGKTISNVDGLVTFQPNVNLMILTADCLPLLVFSPESSVIGIAHAGWKGTIAGVAKNLIRIVTSRFGLNPEDLKVGFGPCIEFCHYEVGEEQIAKIEKANLADSLLKSVSGKTYFDLKQANLKQLLSVGVSRNNIDVTIKSCTYENFDFYSWRREKPVLSGNFASVLGLKNG